MRIGIDVSMIDENKAGIGYYAFSLVEALSQIDKKNEYFLFTYNSELLKGLELGSNFEIIEVKAPLGNLRWMISCLRTIVGLNLAFFLSPSNLFWGCVLRNCVTVIHDIGQIIHPEFFPKKGNIFYKVELFLLLKFGGLVITPSNAVRDEMIKRYKIKLSRIFVIKEGLHNWVFNKFSEQDLEDIKKKYNLPENYILSVSTLEPRKNIDKAILGFKEFLINNPDYKFVIAGKKGWFYNKIFETVEKYQLQQSVQFLDYVPDNDLGAIYQLSKFVVSLSFYEGFGLPLIEANAKNKFVLASDIAAYKELNIAGIYINPHSEALDVAKSMESLLDKEFEPREGFIDTYSWKNTAVELVDILSAR